MCSVAREMEETRRNSFCVFCYKPGSGVHHSKRLDGIRSAKFLKFFQRYLNVIPSKKDNQKVSEEFVTCDNCYELGEEFCNLFFQWESLRLQMEWKVKRMWETMKCAERDPSRSEAFKRQFKRVDVDVGDGENKRRVFKSIRNFRMELLEGCKKKLSPSISLPKLRLKNISDTNDSGLNLSCGNMREIVTKTILPLGKPQLLAGLMSFIAVLYLSPPLHSQKSFSKDNGKGSIKQKQFWNMDKQVQTEWDYFELNTDCGSDSSPVVVDQIFLKTEADVDIYEFVDEEASSVSPSQEGISLRSHWKCPKCSKTFPNKARLELHTQVHHNFGKDLILQDPMRINKRPKVDWNCEKCDLLFDTRAKLRAHTLHSHSHIKSALQHKGTLKRRVIRKKNNKRNQKQANEHEPKSTTAHNGTLRKIFNCDFEDCLKSYLNEAAFQAHQITHQGNTPNKRFDPKNQQKQRTSANEAQQDHNFYNLNNKTPTIPPDFETDTDSTCKKCQICNTSFILASHLNIHMKLEHYNTQPGTSSKCEFANCGMEFSKSKEYINHLYKVHQMVLRVLGEDEINNECLGIFICPEIECPAIFTTLEELGAHFFIHKNLTTSTDPTKNRAQ